MINQNWVPYSDLWLVVAWAASPYAIEVLEVDPRTGRAEMSGGWAVTSAGMAVRLVGTTVEHGLAFKDRDKAQQAHARMRELPVGSTHSELATILLDVLDLLN